MGAQLVGGGSVSPLKETGVRRKMLLLHASNWLQNWCWQKHFGFYDNGPLLEDQYLLGRGGSNSFGEVQVWLHGCSAALEGWMQERLESHGAGVALYVRAPGMHGAPPGER